MKQFMSRNSNTWILMREGEIAWCICVYVWGWAESGVATNNNKTTSKYKWGCAQYVVSRWRVRMIMVETMGMVVSLGLCCDISMMLMMSIVWCSLCDATAKVSIANRGWVALNVIAILLTLYIYIELCCCIQRAPFLLSLSLSHSLLLSSKRLALYTYKQPPIEYVRAIRHTLHMRHVDHDFTFTPLTWHGRNHNIQQTLHLYLWFILL